MDNSTSVSIEAGGVTLAGDLVVPEGATGVVLFAHGSGSSRHSRRNRYVAHVLNKAGLATLLMDLLTMDEERIDAITGHLRFDIEFLAERLVGAAEWLQGQEATRDLRLGYFGTSTGGGAALMAAAQRPDDVGAVVSRGGRPDLAGKVLAGVQAPTLLIVGGNDVHVIPLNETALEQLPGVKKLVLVPGATHLFEEPGTMEEVARLARDWFLEYLVGSS